jgi:hypothetical protein
MLDQLNNSKFFLGIVMIILNIGSRYLVDEFSVNPDDYTRNIILRRIAIFAVCFAATRDIIVSIILTAGFIIIASGVSSKSREGMANQKKAEVKNSGPSKADQPAYDPNTPLLFKNGL